MTLDDTALRLASSPFRVSEFLRKNGANIAQGTIKEAIRRLGFSAGMTERQLSKLTVTPEPDGIKVNLPYHGPTRGNQPKQRWFVRPVGKKAISWVQGGSRFFSKGHFVTGVDGRYVVERGINTGLIQFKSQLKQQTESHLEANRIGQ